MSDTKTRDAEIEQLRAQLARVRSIHSEFKIYDECGHKHDSQDGSILVEEIGYVCAASHAYSICQECCAPGDYQTEECADEHDHSECWPCATRKAVDEFPDTKTALAAGDGSDVDARAKGCVVPEAAQESSPVSR